MKLRQLLLIFAQIFLYCFDRVYSERHSINKEQIFEETPNRIPFSPQSKQHSAHVKIYRYIDIYKSKIGSKIEYSCHIWSGAV